MDTTHDIYYNNIMKYNRREQTIEESVVLGNAKIAVSSSIYGFPPKRKIR